MPSSRKPVKGRAAGLPLRSTGRKFASIDPERIREVVPAAAEQPEAPPAEAVRVREVRQDDGSEGGSGRR